MGAGLAHVRADRRPGERLALPGPRNAGRAASATALERAPRRAVAPSFRPLPIAVAPFVVRRAHDGTSPLPVAMHHPRAHSPRRTFGLAPPAIAPALLLALVAACGSSHSIEIGGLDSGPPAGGLVEDADGFHFVDPHYLGLHQEPTIASTGYGRLVRVYGLDASGARISMADRFVIRPDLTSDYESFVLDTNAATGGEELIVQRSVEDHAPGGGRDQFFELLRQASEPLAPLHAHGREDTGQFSMLPRNAVLVVQVSDLIDEDTLDPTTFRVQVGNPPLWPFEGRAFVDRHHGGMAGDHFHSTRILFDPTVSEAEAFEQDPPLPVNGSGFPASVTTELANFELRIPTKKAPAYGQSSLLRNLSGHPLSTSGGGPFDVSSPTRDLVRAARTGGSPANTGDPFNGYLRDDTPPRLVAADPLAVLEAPVALDGASEFRLPTLLFRSEACAHVPEPGDVVQQPGILAEVVAGGTVQGAVLSDTVVRLLAWPSAWSGAGEWADQAVGDAELVGDYLPALAGGREGCFVQCTPRAKDFEQDPTSRLYTGTLFTVRFSEPLDPETVTAFDSLTVTRAAEPQASADYVVGAVSEDASLQRYTFAPDLPLAHAAGTAESYFLRLAAGALGATDLAGNALEVLPPPIELTLDPDEPSQRSGGRVSRFSAVDEEPPFGDAETGPLVEWTGQILYDLPHERIRPRPVIHSLGVIDRDQPVVSLMKAFPQGLQTPLSALGSRTQTVWRSIDFGMSLTDRTSHDLDVEGLYWSPVDPSLVAETFSQFEMVLAHSAHLPDEYPDPSSALPKYPDSGLKDKFVKNYLDKQEDPPKVVHPKQRGYSIRPGDVIVAPGSTTALMPWPMNRDLAPKDWSTWTWRDTSVRKRDADKGGGADPDALFRSLGMPLPCNKVYPKGQVRTIGLPLLMEFRCYPDSGAFGANALDVSFAVNSSADPTFRAWSTGGYDGNKVRPVDPETETEANGGWNPTTFQQLPGRDNTVYMGAADFVVRVSRSYSLWFAATDPETGTPFPAPHYHDAVMEPAPQQQPDGTRITLSYRGAIAFTPQPSSCDGSPNLDPIQNASSLDAYGDHYDDRCLPPPGNDGCLPVVDHRVARENLGIAFLNGDDTWKDDLSAIDGASYYQVCLTFESDIFTGLTPTLSAVALTWTE